MRDYLCFYRGKRVSVRAESSYAAQQAAEKALQALSPRRVTIKRHEITVCLADTPIPTAIF